MDTIRPWELLIIVVVLVALFGANRLPKMARSVGEGIREFRSAFREGSDPSATGAAGGEPTGRAGQVKEQDAGGLAEGSQPPSP